MPSHTEPEPGPKKNKFLVRMFAYFVFSKSRGIFSREDFQLLYPVVDGFSIMTYDYSSHGGYVLAVTFFKIPP